ncbi:hypothetical protein MAM1_0368d10086 [Mucor ambiguus]|uniref:Uncharacterized protein n=1 Tax=Mucor ambiguus TaxID=91626 RepID=A0A0C9N7C1_9FUNG|nr:hypothetical protein MAM1_0368d10086 [Mucor ambiguus]
MPQNLQLLPFQPLTANQNEACGNISAIQELDAEKIKKAFELTKPTYKRTRTVNCQPFPLPANDCIPTMASVEQTELYEAQFTGVLCNFLENRTIGDLLKIYSLSDKQIPIGKISFLGSFFQKITAKNISLDVVILCRDLESQNYLLLILQAISLNCDHLTSHSDRRETFGVIVKIRKAGKPITPIKQATNVDLVLVYDSAISVPNRVLWQFKGIDYDRPLVAHISAIDSADIRCYNNPIAHKQYNWGTKYKNVQDAQQIFHQSNRHPERQHFFAWNDYVATEVAEWVALKQNIPYQFFRPNKNHPAIKGYRAWGGGHPLNGNPCKPVAPKTPKTPKTPDAPKAPKAPKTPKTPNTPKAPKTPKTHNAPNVRTITNGPGAPNAPSACAATASPGAVTKSKKKQKIKEEVQQKAAAPSPSSNVPNLPPVASTSAARRGLLSVQPFSSSPTSPTPMQIDRAPTTTYASANVENTTDALSSNVGSADQILHGLDYIPFLPDKETEEPSTGDKRSSEKDSLAEASTSTKKAKLNNNSFMPTFDFNSIFDEALQKFEEQMNSLNTKI